MVESSQLPTNDRPHKQGVVKVGSLRPTHSVERYQDLCQESMSLRCLCLYRHRLPFCPSVTLRDTVDRGRDLFRHVKVKKRSLLIWKEGSLNRVLGRESSSEETHWDWVRLSSTLHIHGTYLLLTRKIHLFNLCSREETRLRRGPLVSDCSPVVETLFFYREEDFVEDDHVCRTPHCLPDPKSGERGGVGP